MGATDPADPQATNQAAAGLGAVLFNLNGTAAVRFSTLAGNRVAGGGGRIVPWMPASGAIYSLTFGNSIATGGPAEAALTVEGSIVTATQGLDADPDPANRGKEVEAALYAGRAGNTNTGALQWVGANLIDSVATSADATVGRFQTLALAASGSGTATAPAASPAVVGTLADHGGPTWTMLPNAGSPAINGAAATCPNANGTDQRGITRPNGPACDIGAVEVEGYTLSVNTSGSGTVSAGISPVPLQGSINACGSAGPPAGTCEALYAPAASVTLTATAGAGYTFTGWGTGPCTNANPDTSGTCTVTLDQARSVTASFGALTNGACGSAHNTTRTSAPSTAAERCSAGTAGTVTGSGPWSWTCAGLNGGSTAACTAQLPSYTITATADPTNGGNVNCQANSVNHGGATTCIATPATGYSFSGWSGCTSSNATQCTLSDIQANTTVTATFVLVRKTYTGPLATGNGTGTVTVAGGGDTCGFSDARFIPLTSVATAPPPGNDFPYGLFTFRLSHCTVGGTVTLSIRYPAVLASDTRYWKYGPTPGQADHWYLFSQASIQGDTVTFNLTDGGPGDSDLTADGTISDPSGPAVPPSATDIPTLSEGALLLLATLLLIGGMRYRRRRSLDDSQFPNYR